MMEPVFELIFNDEPVAILKFRNSFGSLAEGVVSEGSFTFKREGFLNTHVTVRQSGVLSNLAIYRNNTWSGGGTLIMNDGRQFMANSNFWESQFEITDQTETPLIRYTNIGGFKLHSKLDILKPSSNIPELPWMVLLGWYLAVMTSRDGEMVAALF
jgi:hypothetical protein